MKIFDASSVMTQANESNFFSSLSETEKVTFLSYTFEQEVSENEYAVHAEDSSKHLYLLLEGSAISDSKTEFGQAISNESFAVGDLIGLLGFVGAAKHAKSVRCITQCKFAVLSSTSFNNMFTLHADLWRKLQQIGLKLMRRMQLQNHLDRLFGPFGVMLPYVLNDIENEIEWLTLHSGDILYSQGDKSQNAYILVTGRLQMITTLTDGREVLNSTVLVGETVGETALLIEQPQANTVFATRDSVLVKLSNRSFELMLQRNTRAIHNISKILGRRLVNHPVERSALATPIRCISLIPADASVGLTDFAEALETELRIYGSTLLLTSQFVEDSLQVPAIADAGDNEAASLRLTEWLHQQEDSCRYLVYQADPQWSGWSARCVRQTDQVVVVADASKAPHIDDVARRLCGKRQNWSLVLLHPADLDRPRNTASWLEQGNANAVFHVRQGNSKDLGRLARILTGNSISLVLGGGGARGFAHLGVLKSLNELNIPIDMIGGTSMGAPIAGIIAQGASLEEIQIRSKEAFHKIIDYTLPLVSLLAGRRISDTIKKQSAGWNIEDFWLPFFCVSTNLTTAKSVVHRRGDSWLAIRSSVSIPGVLPPGPYEQDLLIDGGVLNNLPVDIMREISPFGTIIAIDVVPPIGPKARSEYGTEMSGWRLFFDRILPWKRTLSVPGISSTIMQAMVTGSALKRQQILDQNLADLYLNIHVKGVGMLEFTAQDKAAKIGYEVSIEKLREFVQTRKPIDEN